MNSRSLAVLLALILALTISPPTLPAQTNSNAQSQTGGSAQDWQELRDLDSGKKIRVEFKSGSTIDGKLVSLLGTTLTVAEGKNNFVLEQRDIQRVYRLKGRWSRARAARIGAIVGLVIGAIAGGKAMSRLESMPNRIPSDADEVPMIAGTLLGTLGGAGVGYLLGGKRKGKLLYEAK